jgi:hypothetical protein
MAARLSALRSAGRQQVSASTMGVRQVTGSHVLRIDGFTQLSKTVANNTEMRSGTFNVGGHDWCLACYPNGCSDLYKGYVSIFLQQESHEKTGAATAKGQLSILDRDGMPSCTKHITERTFTDDHVEVAAPAAPPFDLHRFAGSWLRLFVSPWVIDWISVFSSSIYYIAPLSPPTLDPPPPHAAPTAPPTGRNRTTPPPLAGPLARGCCTTGAAIPAKIDESGREIDQASSTSAPPRRR